MCDKRTTRPAIARASCCLHERRVVSELTNTSGADDVPLPLEELDRCRERRRSVRRASGEHEHLPQVHMYRSSTVQTVCRRRERDRVLGDRQSLVEGTALSRELGAHGHPQKSSVHIVVRRVRLTNKDPIRSLVETALPVERLSEIPGPARQMAVRGRALELLADPAEGRLRSDGIVLQELDVSQDGAGEGGGGGPLAQFIKRLSGRSDVPVRSCEVTAPGDEPTEIRLDVGLSEPGRRLCSKQGLTAVGPLGDRRRPVVQAVGELTGRHRRGPPRLLVVAERPFGRLLTQLVLAASTTVNPAGNEPRPTKTPIVL